MVVQPVLTYSVPKPQPQRSWRAWGGIQNKQDAEQERIRIKKELTHIQKEADYPLSIKSIVGIQSKDEVFRLQDSSDVDVFLIYAAGGWMDIFDAIHELGKDMIFFCRHRSGPVYLWYEIISPRYLRQHTDALSIKGITYEDVVIDDTSEILWRLRSLCGLKNALNTRILAVGGPGAWSQPKGVVPGLVREKWKYDIRTVSYRELGALITEARADKTAVNRAESRARQYVRNPQVRLETKHSFVDNAFLLEEVFRKLMNKAECRAVTIRGCMGTIMPLAETSACLTLSLLNDSGYLAFCESDFVVIPAGVLLAHISGKPVFLNDPTFPHNGVITLAHCTAPRKMNGKTLEPVRILTHFESDYGAAPKVEMMKGQELTNIIPDFASQKWLGLSGKILDSPFMDICRSQIDVGYECSDRRVAEKMKGFHWMTGYGQYFREVGYALRRKNIHWEMLS
ncbi:MAG: sugar isomerase [Candidatus Aminicenantes bacterium]|nr:sugar isomerase [Candidatus Aminicenantes bacterium]